MKEFIKENEKEIKVLKEYIEERNHNKNDLIMILHKAQDLFGYLPKEVQRYIAKELNMPTSKVYGVVTFYSYFTTEKKGKYSVNVCLGTACFVRGAEVVLNEFKKLLDIDMNETTKDGMFTLESIRCIGACGLAPVVSVNGKIYGNVKKEDVAGILAEYKGGNKNE